MIDGLKRRPLQPYQQEKEGKKESRRGDDSKRYERTPGSDRD